MLIKILVLILCIGQFSSVLSYGPLTQLLDNLFSNYDGGIRPNYNGKAVKVGMTAYILSIASVDTDKQEFTLSMYLRQSWNDPRLKFNKTAGIGSRKSNDTIVLDLSKSSLMWVPDTFVVNERTSFVHKLTIPNEFVRIASDGSVLKSERVTLTAGCAMDLHYFPMDQQFCTVEFESYGFTAHDIEYFWSKGLTNSVGVSDEVSNTEFRVIGHRLREEYVSLTTGNYSRLGLEVHFERSYGKYITRYYTPLTMFVSVSLLALWISRPEIGALICFLNIGLINLFMAMGWAGGLKRDSVASFLDDYVTLCLYHIYICLIVSMLNLYFVSNRKNQSRSMEMRFIGRANGRTGDDIQNLCESQTRIPNLTPIGRHLATAKRITELICEYTRWVLIIVFPFSIFIYCIAIWGKTSHWVPHEDFIAVESYGM